MGNNFLWDASQSRLINFIIADAGADIFTFHVEVEGDLSEIIENVKAAGMKVGLAVKPGTPIETVFPFVEKLDQILVMTVEPGIYVLPCRVL